MVKSVDIEEFLELSRQNPVVDVRSPSEYAYGRIPGAVNLPLFEDDERAEIGTLYKQQGKDIAVKRGLEMVGPKMRPMVEFAEQLTFKDHILVHCWRGGMRSGSVAWLLQTYGLPVVTLKGGYKRFRNHVLDKFGDKMELMVITGPTGSGKTDLIKALATTGQQVVDLEGLAHHKGSVFGELGQEAQPSSEHFQNELFWAIKDFDFSQPVWLEDESIGIGKVMIPEAFWRQMGKSSRVHFNMDRNIRIKRLVSEYASFPQTVLDEKITVLEKKLGGQHAKSALELLRSGDFAGVADVLLVYYDRAYKNALIRHKNDLLLEIEADHEDFAKWAELVIEKTKTQYV
ncbi:MAG: tRNA 2-selenouridine(34) synthase MnmH [Imperialibacter sp.]